MDDSVAHERKQKHLLKLHRSFRFVTFRSGVVLATFAAAAALSATITLSGTRLLGLHENLRRLFLRWTSIPISGFQQIRVFGSTTVLAPVTPIMPAGSRPWVAPLIYAVIIVTLAVTYFSSKFSRSLVVFGVILMMISAGDGFLNPPAGSSFLPGYWLRYEFVLWILLPWIVAILAASIMPSAWVSILWMIAVPAYTVIWSAVRLALCSGLLFHAGSTFLLLFWSIFGIIAEVLSLCFFYSVIAWQASSLYRRQLVREAAHG